VINRTRYAQQEYVEQLKALYEDLIREGVLEDMELYHIDPIRMVPGHVAGLIRRVTRDSTIDVTSEEDKDSAVYASSILMAAESLAQEDLQTRESRLDEIKEPLQRSMDLLLRIIADEKAIHVSKEALRQNVDILRRCMAKLDEPRS